MGVWYRTSDPSGATSYLYDGDGNRLISRDATGTTLYLPGQDLRYDSATATTAGTRYYTHNATTVASRTMAGLTWLAGDHQGTHTVAVEQATLSVTQRRPNPFGVPRGGTPSWPNPHGFVGGVNDPTGLTHPRARCWPS